LFGIPRQNFLLDAAHFPIFVSGFIPFDGY